MNNFLKRILTGIVLILIMVSAIMYNQYSFFVLFYFIHLLGLLEFYKLMALDFARYRKVAGSIVSSSLYITSALVLAGVLELQIVLITIPLAFLILVIELFLLSQNPFMNLAVMFFGIIYLTIPCIIVIEIPQDPFEQNSYNYHFMLGYLSIVWASDSGAYAFGKLFGKHLLFERISPKKTWEGSLGGACCVLIVAYVASLSVTELTLSNWMIIAIITIVIGTFGDLIKSLLKRKASVKDSGTILPGHGGILDRFDSLLSSSLLVFCYLHIIK